MKSPEQNGGDELAPLIKMCSSCDDYFFLDSSNSHAVDYVIESKKYLNHLYTTCPHCKQTEFSFTKNNPLRFIRNLSDKGIPIIEMVEPYPLVDEIYSYNNPTNNTNSLDQIPELETANGSSADLTPEQDAVVKYFSELLSSFIKTGADFAIAVEGIKKTPIDIDIRNNNDILLATCNSCALNYEISNSNTELLLFTEIDHVELNGVSSKCPHCYANNYSMSKDYLDKAMRKGIQTKLL